MKKILLSMSLLIGYCGKAQFIPQKQLQLKAQSGESTIFNDVKIKPNGIMYVVGYADPNSDIDPGPGVYATGSGKCTFVYQYNTNVNAFDWLVIYPTNGMFNSLKGIDVNSNGDVFVTGLFDNSMDINPGASTATVTSFQASVLIKFNNLGVYQGFREIVAGNSGGTTITIDNADNIFVTGFVDGTANFDPSLSNYTLTTQSADLFLMKYNSSMGFAWAQLVGSSATESSFQRGIDQVQFDNSGNIYTVAKIYGSTTIAGTSLAAMSECLIKLNSNGVITDCWKFDITQPYGNRNLKVQVNKDASFFISGSFYGTVDFDPTVGTLTKTVYSGSSASDQFVGLYKNNGEPLWLHTFSEYIGEIFPAAVADANKNIYVWGNYASTNDYDPSTGTASFPYSFSNSNNAIISYDSLGNFKNGTTFMNGADLNGYCIMGLHPVQNRLWFMGAATQYEPTDYAPGVPTMTLSAIGSNEGIVTMYDMCSSSFQSTVNPSICSGATYTLPTGSTVSTAATYTSNLKSYWGCDSLIYTNLSVTALPSLSISPSTATVCSGNSIILTVSGASSYTWASGEITHTVSITPSASGQQSVTGILNGCTSSVTKFVNVIPVPNTPNAAVTSTLVCVNTTDFLLGSGSNGTYNWIGPDGYNETGATSSITYSSTTQSGVYTVTATDNGCVSNEATITVSVSLCTDINEYVNNSLIIYPNPFIKKLSVNAESSDYTIVIVDAVGKIVYNQNKLAYITELDLNFLSPGIYHLTFKDGDKSFTQKIVKQ
jgi:hypothetical protein